MPRRFARDPSRGGPAVSTRTTPPERTDRYTLWGTAHSLYTGKVRSYLIKKGVAFQEIHPTHPRFQTEIVPAVGLLVVPVLETPDGELVQDTTDIVEHLEACQPGAPMIPVTPVQRVVAWLLDAYGSEALLPLAMHYRWSYRARQENFLRAEFGRAVHAGPDRAGRLAAGLQLMEYFNSFLPPLGVTLETVPVIEAIHLELLDVLDIHFQHHPYLLGGHPSIADFGFMAPLYAHLARDPVPATLMKNVAPNVYRWTERMNTPGIVDGEFWDRPAALLPEDEIPATVLPVLRLIFETWGPELRANVAAYTAWLEAHPALPSGHVVAHQQQRKVHPTLGQIEYQLRGTKFARASHPHSLWHFEKAASLARALDGEASVRLTALLQATDGVETMRLRLPRPMKRDACALVLD